MSFLLNLREEQQSAYLYRVLTQVEADKSKVELFSALARAADEQAVIWRKKLEDQGTPVPDYIPGIRVRIVEKLIRSLGPRGMLPVLAAMKVRGISIYKTGTQGHAMPTSVDDIGHRHVGVGTGGNLRAAVFGVNDGLVSNACLILGVAGASAQSNQVVVAGIAGLLAGAFSMAAGEYVSMRSQRELYEYQIAVEREELEEYPEEETEELALIYEARGLSKEKAKEMAVEIMKDKETALDTLSREELGLNPDDLGSPVGAALSSFGAFSIGALVPLMPYVFGGTGIAAPVLLTLLALFGVGAVISLFTGRHVIYSGLRMVMIGSIAGVISYMIGGLIGSNLL